MLPETMTKATQAMGESIIELIQQRRSVTFAELHEIAGFAPTDDEAACQIVIGDLNLVLWANLTPVAFAALNQLHGERAIAYVPTELMLYAFDGHGLRLPIAKGLRRYQRPHWLPVLIRLSSLEEYEHAQAERDDAVAYPLADGVR